MRTTARFLNPGPRRDPKISQRSIEFRRFTEKSAVVKIVTRVVLAWFMLSRHNSVLKLGRISGYARQRVKRMIGTRIPPTTTTNATRFGAPICSFSLFPGKAFVCGRVRTATALISLSGKSFHRFSGEL